MTADCSRSLFFLPYERTAMLQIFRDKYCLLCLAVAGILVSVGVLDPHGEENDSEEGIVHDVTVSTSGFVFVLDSLDGEHIRCFCREEPVSGGLYRIDGAMSEDGTIYFVSVLRHLE